MYSRSLTLYEDTNSGNQSNLCILTPCKKKLFTTVHTWTVKMVEFMDENRTTVQINKIETKPLQIFKI